MGSARSTKVIMQANDVVFAEITAALYLNKDQQFVAWILYAMGGADSNVDRFTCLDNRLLIVQCDPGGSLDHDPVLRPLRVLLIAQSLSGEHLNALHLEVNA